MLPGDGKTCAPSPNAYGAWSMRVLVIFCHPRRNSFSGRVLERVLAGLDAGGHGVELADLYREGFQPVFQESDYAQFEGGTMPEEILREQARVERNDALVLIFPVWWWSFPAMLKGWFDRVWSNGWAYEFANNPTGSLLEPRPFGLIACAASSDEVYRRRGYEEALSRQVETGVLGFCGVSASRIAILNDVGWDAEREREHLFTAERLGRTFPDWLRTVPGATNPTG
jgi:NAD(P)H dehydrogenase (quinone)